MTPYEEAAQRLFSGYYNSGIRSVVNPGGFAGDGHETNFPAALADVGLVVTTVATAAALIPAAAPNAAAAQRAADDAQDWFHATQVLADRFRPVTPEELWEGLNDTNFLSALGLFNVSKSQPLDWAPTIQPSRLNGLNRHVTVLGHTILANPIDFIRGQSGRFRFTIGGAGSYTLSVGSSYRFPYGLEDLSSSPGSVDSVSYFVHAPDDIECAIIRNLF